jgi:3-mercaptopyruvate sulfurtransferase SseA
MVLFVGTFTLTGCGSGGGSDDYDAPEAPKTEYGRVINVETLKAAMDAGKVNSDEYDRWIIIQRDMDDDNNRIPGAQEWGVNGIDRIDGPILSGNMVFDGPTMETWMQKIGVKEGSTIVFCGSDTDQASRIYFMFRYWGFPKERLVLLNGGFPAWKAAGYPVTKVAPDANELKSEITLAAEVFNMEQNVRASLNEAINGVRSGEVQPYSTLPYTVGDFPRTTETLDGNGENTTGDDGDGRYVLFQGELAGNLANDLAGQDLLQAANPDGVKYYKTPDQMRTYLEGLGYDLSKPIMTYCRAGNYASYGFGPIDAVLGPEGVEVMLYDGSYSQWGSLSKYELANTYTYDADTDTFGDPKQLPYLLPNKNSDDVYDFSKWATDDLTDELYYLVEYEGKQWDSNGDKVIDAEDEYFDPATHIQRPYFYVAPESPTDEGANTIEDADYEYFMNGSAGDAPSAMDGAIGGC